jgi:hypothetical protein
MAHALLSVLTALALAAAGSCDPAQFRHPLSDPAKAKPDARLEGTWGGRDGDTRFLLVAQAREDQRLDLLLVGRGKRDGVAQVAWEAFPSTLGGKTYLNLQEKKYSDLFGNKFTLEPTYWLVRYALTPDSLTLFWLPKESIESPDGGAPLLEADSAALAAAVPGLPDTAFKAFLTFKRVASP